jgi:regulator of CtrA degradation
VGSPIPFGRGDGVWRLALNSEMAPDTVQDAPISFAVSFVASDAFRALFREGMGLVETTAAYLDGPGRDESKTLPRMLALAYASESMRLTTRLMQLASWLLLQRAVAEGEMTSDDARRQKDKVRLAQQTPINGPDAVEALPAVLQDLIAQSLRLQARIRHLDDLMEGRVRQEPDATNPVQAQQKLLASIFRN